jgi:anaerobic selenocysteine-containing dehydrogenase
MKQVQQRQLHYRTCNLCEAMCGLAIEHDGERVLSIRGDEHDPFSRGYICPKAVALGDLHSDPDRLRTPQGRDGAAEGAHWRDCDWEEALQTSAERIVEIQDKYGSESVALYVGNPTVHNFGAMLFGPMLFKALGTRNRYSATSVDQLPHMLASLLMFGHQLLLPVPDIDRTDHVLMLGANPMVSNGSLMCAPDFKRRLRELKQRGGRFTLIDPRRTETAKLADEHLFIKPGSDALLLAAIVHTLCRDELVDLAHLASFTDGASRLGGLFADFAPDKVSQATGIDGATIERLAHDFASADRAVCYGRVGVCTQQFGGLNGWLVNLINIITGNLDRAGGSMFTKPAFDLVAFASAAGFTGHFDKGRSRVRGLPEFGGEYPVVTLAEEIETPGDGQIRALVTLAGNPVLSTPNGSRLAKALGGLDFMVSVDIYRNETTRFANYILPPTSQLEQSHYDVAFNALAVRNVAKYSRPLFKRADGSRDDWEILVELSTRIQMARGGIAGVTARMARAAMLRIGPEGLLSQGLRWGPYGAGALGIGGKREALTLDKLEAAPHGLDLGALETCLPGRLSTKDKRIVLIPDCFAQDLPRLSQLRDATSNGELRLIGRRQLRTNNSWLHNSYRMAKGTDRCTILMHEIDATTRGLSHEIGRAHV